MAPFVLPVKKQKSVLLALNLLSLGFIVYGAILAAVFGPLKYYPYLMGSVIIWGLVCVIFAYYVQHKVMLCPECGKNLRKRGGLIMAYPKKCPHCGCCPEENSK